MISPCWAWALLLFFFALAFYLMVGYPLLLWKWPFPRLAVAKDLSYLPSVSVLMAVHNGADFLEEKLNSLLALDYPPDKLEIHVLSDASSDQTEAIALRYADRGVILHSLPRGGKAAALNYGMNRATGDIFFFTDVRQKLHPQALRQLVANFADSKVGAVTGELRITPLGGVEGEQAAMDLYWRYELWARSKQSAQYSLFNTTGCLYAMRRSLTKALPPHTLIDDAELPLQAYLAGYRILFDPTSLAYDFPTAQGTEWSRRMRTLGGMWQVFARHPRLLFLPHPMWLHFVSHKFGRLLLPWCLLGIAITTLLLPAGWPKTFLLWNEAALLLLAAVFPLLGEKSALRRYSSWARTFLVMNFAAILSLKVFFVDPQRMWLTTQVDRERRAS
ncbi:glycosyltransferase family 2 protein [Bryobacter aggregatus]|uniref:glycosyltransferase family 2 protein n=1 Tax=Bryobacter aggregatus TaxID=360054 RepID=UPI00068FD3A9|nr:glycosyltransferase family 2 protein [Bryobacter aggregatus]